MTIALPRWALAALIAVIAVITALVIAACTTSGPSGVALENSASGNIATTFNAAQPIPHFQRSDYRAALTQIEAIQALGTQTTSFFFNQGERDPQGSCPSLGMPIPNTAQLSNPDLIVPDPNGGSPSGSLLLPNMDPNGVYTPASSTGTYVLCLNAAGQPYANYWEGFVQSVSGAAHWDYGTHQLIHTGDAKMPVCSQSIQHQANGKAKRVTTCAAP